MSESGKAIFPNYASQDAAGVEVWFDQSELREIDAWIAATKK